MTYTEFVDITGSNADNAPLVGGGVRAYYATGSEGIQASPAQMAAAAAAGMGIILIDQSPSLSVFAAGNADVADVEPYAGTDSAAQAAVAQRQARGEDSTLYVSYDNLAALKAAIKNPANVYYWVANYAWSLAEAEAQLAANGDWRAIQYGDPTTNPTTLVPGTSVTLQEAQADIDVGLSAWTDTFLPWPPPLPGQWHQFVSAYPSGSDVVLVGVGTDSRVYSLTKVNNTTWASAPVNIGPAIPGQWVGGVPFAVIPDSGNLLFVGQGTNGYLYATLLSTAAKTFGSPYVYSPLINAPPALPGQWHQFVSAYPSGSDVVLVGVGTDSRVYSLTKVNNTTWASSPVNIGPAIPGQWVGGVPFAVIPDGDNLLFVGQGTNGSLYATLLSTAAKTFGAPYVYSPPPPGQWKQFVSAYPSGSDVVLVGVGTDSRVYSLTNVNNTWPSAPVNIGPAIPGQWVGGVPFAVIPDGDNLLFVGQGTNGYLYATLLTTAAKAFGSPYVYSPLINAPPALAGQWHQFVSAYPSGSDVVLVGVGTDSRVYSLTKVNNTTWASSPVNIGPAIPGQWVGGVPFADVPDGGNLLFVGLGTNDYLYATLLSTSGKTFGSPYVYSPRIN